ncbi:MAG: DUF86 domain-containing protein [Chloroflexota bacterium]|nr:DUF86 domain-containing protein [Chloroflexota bacterium]
MNDATKKRLLDALLACRAIARYTASLDFAAYEQDELIRDAVERRLGVVGEALNRAAAADPILAERFPEIRRIVALRNRVIHEYDAVDDEIVWDVVTRRLPGLQARLEALLGADEAASRGKR